MFIPSLFITSTLHLMISLKGELIYANYGRKQDFEYLKSLGIDIRGRIVIARYGAIFRGNIVTKYKHFK